MEIPLFNSKKDFIDSLQDTVHYRRNKQYLFSKFQHIKEQIPVVKEWEIKLTYSTLEFGSVPGTSNASKTILISKMVLANNLTTPYIIDNLLYHEVAHIMDKRKKFNKNRYEEHIHDSIFHKIFKSIYPINDPCYEDSYKSGCESRYVFKCNEGCTVHIDHSIRGARCKKHSIKYTVEKLNY
jgi:hypothetical protein